MLDGGHYRADDRQGADTIKQDPGGQPAPQLALAVAVDETVKALIKVPPSAQDRPNSNADDKKGWVVALLHIIDHVF